MHSIKSHQEKKSLIKTKQKKVTRKNKYSGKKILIAGISLAILFSGIGVSINEYKNDKADAYSNTIIISNSNLQNIHNNIKDIDFVQVNYNDVNKIYLDYEDRSMDQKAYNTRSYYGNIIDKYSKMYGLDPALVGAIATQERGVHSEVMDNNGAIGLMQIQKNIWSGNYIEAYNFETNNYEGFVVDSNQLSDISYNVEIGCMVLQNALNYMNYNIPAAIQCYNMGYGNVMKILNQYSIDTGKTVDDILLSNDLGWINYRNFINSGDSQYLEHVLSWIGSTADINVLKPDRGVVKVSISNENVIKSLS